MFNMLVLLPFSIHWRANINMKKTTKHCFLGHQRKASLLLHFVFVFLWKGCRSHKCVYKLLRKAVTTYYSLLVVHSCRLPLSSGGIVWQRYSLAIGSLIAGLWWNSCSARISAWLACRLLCTWASEAYVKNMDKKIYNVFAVVLWFRKSVFIIFIYTPWFFMGNLLASLPIRK